MDKTWRFWIFFFSKNYSINYSTIIIQLIYPRSVDFVFFEGLVYLQITEKVWKLIKRKENCEEKIISNKYIVQIELICTNKFILSNRKWYFSHQDFKFISFRLLKIIIFLFFPPYSSKNYSIIIKKETL